MVPALGDLTWPDVAALAGQVSLAVPLGSTEQHGPHLPLSTDTDVAVALAARLAVVRCDVIVAPPFAYGSSGEHAGFPGTLSIGRDALEMVLVELVRSADAFRGVILVSAHGGNAVPVETAVARLRGEGRRVMSWSPAGAARGPGDSHAGHTETSVMLRVAAPSVRTDRYEAGATEPIADLMPVLRTGGLATVSPNGVLGDPTGASPAEGEAILEAWVADLVSAVEQWA